MLIDFLRRRDRAPLLCLLLGWSVYLWRFFNSPPRLSGDAAWVGLHAFDFLRRGIWPFYIPHMFAPNPLLAYLEAPVFVVFGFTVTTLHGVSALMGALAFPAVYIACREVLAETGAQFARRAGLIAMLGFSLSPFIGSYFGIGEEIPLVPVLELITVAALWRGMRQGKWLDFCLAGVTLGFSQYAYIVARAFPVALGGVVLLALLPARRFFPQLRGLLLTACVAALVALPQWLFFLSAPYTFVARTQLPAGRLISSVPGWETIFPAKLLNQFLMLGVQWNNAHNPLSGRPLLTAVLFLGFLAAVIWIMRSRRTPFLFILYLAGAMLLVDLLSYEILSPWANRLIGAIPFLFMLAGVGCALIWQWLGRFSRLYPFAGLLVVGGVLVGAVESQWDFSRRVLPQVNALPGREWQASLVEMAEADFIHQHLDTAILIPTSEYQRSPLAFLLANDFPERAGGLAAPLTPGEMVRVVNPVAPGRPTTGGLLNYIPDEWVLLKGGVAYFLPPLPGSLSSLGESQSIYASNGVKAAVSFSARWQGKAPQITPLSFEFENGLDLIGYHAADLVPGEPITITLYWRPRQPVAADVAFFTQILDSDQRVIAGVHDWVLNGAYRVRAWTPGETMPVSYSLVVPAGAAPGPYTLITGVFDVIRQKRVLLVSGNDYAAVARLKIPLVPDTTTPAQTLNAELGRAIRLQGYTLTPMAGAVQAKLFWQTTEALVENYTVFVHVVDENGQMVSQSDVEPRLGQYPTSIWSPGEMVLDTITVRVPAGEYQVFAGMYLLETQERLPVKMNGQTMADGRLFLGTVRIP